MKFLMLLMLMLLFVTISSTGQSIQPLDSNSVKMSITELNFVTSQFIELEACKAQNGLISKQIGILKRIIDDKDKIIEVRNNIISLLNERIEAVEPQWWNKFGWGFGCAAFFGLCLLFIIK